MGHLRQRSDGSWQIIVHNGYNANGKAVRHHETLRGSKKSAQQRMRELESGLDRGIPIPVGKLTIAEHLRQWFDGYVKTNCCQRTQDSYQSIINTHLLPFLGHIQLKQLNPQTIQAYYGKTCEKLCTRTVQHHHRMLSQSLKWAVRQGYLGRNPCELVDAPSPRKHIMRTLTPTEAEIMLETARDNQYYPVIYTAVSSGLRQAELLGLRWRDLDLDLLSISVSQVLYKRRGVCIFKEPKTSGSSRRVSMTPKLGLFLRETKRQREILYLELGRPLSLDDLVFANIDGGPVDPCTLTHNFARIIKRAGLERVRFHDLRHTFASLMLLRGAKPKVISEALGHASVAFTMDVYSHIISGMQEDAMALLDEVLPAGVCTSNERQGQSVQL
jgi:integrase